MPLSNKEKQKRYKEKLKQDPDKYEEYKKKKRDNYHAKKRLVKDLTPKEKINARTIWRLRKKTQRIRNRNLNKLLDVTPPSSPTSIQQENILHDDVGNVPINNDNGGVEIAPQPISLDSPTARRGRKKIKRDRSKLYRENQKLKLDNAKLKQKYEKYKKKQQRYAKKLEEIEKKTVKKITIKEKYKTLSNAIKERYDSLKKRNDKRLIRSVFDKVDPPAKKQIANDALGTSGKLRTVTHFRASATALQKRIQDYYKRDDISRATAGRKETVTRNKTKEQKRFLLDTMKNLYRAFKTENPETQCSYFYFARNKPFYIVKQTVDGREMCLCKTHVNPIYKACELKRKHIINTDDLNSLILSTVCDPNKQTCMYGTCQDCCGKESIHDTKRDIEKISWAEWGRKEEFYEKDGKKMKAVKNIKENKEGSVQKFMEELNKELKVLKKHVYNIKVQYKCFRQAVDNLKKTEVVLVADFSENYNGKYHEEVQAHHFSGSREQISLHTVVVYVLGNDGKVQAESFCTISSCTNHQPAAIWAHLEPVLNEIRNKYPQIKTIHFFSDGPFNQYRQKQNFYLCSTKTFDQGFSSVTWSFFEAGHGKGPADGIGGFLKRTADNIVAAGKDIPNASKFFVELSGQSKIRLYMISEEDIDAVAEQLPKNIKPLVGTLHVHQIFTDVREELMFRDLGCFCSRGFCNCFRPKKYRPIFVFEDKRRKQIDKKSKKTDNTSKKTANNKQEKQDVSSDFEDDIPLSTVQSSRNLSQKDIDLTDLCKYPGKSVYDIVYSPKNSDEEEQQPESSGTKAAFYVGDFLLVNVRSAKGKNYRYACIIDDLDDDGELKVTFLRCVKKGVVFRLDTSDVAYIDHTDIITVIHTTPETETKHGQVYYKFKEVIDVFEN